MFDKSALSIVDGIRDKSYINTDRTAYYGNNQANVLTNINFQNFLNMNVDDTRNLESHRSIYVCQPEGSLIGLIGTNIYSVEPDFRYNAINLDGTPSDVVSIENGVLKAEKEGTAVVLVGYDAFGYYSFVSDHYGCNYAFNTAIWPENIDPFVVHVGTNGDIKTNMTINEGLNIDLNEDGTYKYGKGEMDESAVAGKTAGNFLDSELDALYYVDGEPGYNYTFTPEAGCTVKVYNPVFSDGKLSSFSEGKVTSAEDGSFTVLMTEGRNIIEVEKDGSVTYQVATVKKTTMEVSYEYKTENGKLYPGDVITVQYGALDSPQSRMYMYNTHTYVAMFDIGADGKLLSKFTDAPSETVIGAYDFANYPENHKVVITIPESAEPGKHTLNGAFIIKGFGSPLGNHHAAGAVAKFMSAPSINAVIGQLPGITITVADYGKLIYDTGVELKTGTEFTSSRTIGPSDRGYPLLDTLHVMKGDKITYTVNCATNVLMGYASGSCPTGWELTFPGGGFSSKQVVYTFEATESGTYQISYSWSKSPSFTVKVLVYETNKAVGEQIFFGKGTIADASIADGFEVQDGKTVVRWNDDKDFKGTWYNIGDTISLVGTKTLYGEVAVPTVTYNVPNGTFSLKNGETEVKSGEQVNAGTELTLTYDLDKEHLLALTVLGKQIPLSDPTTTYKFTVNSNVDISSAAAKTYHYYLVDSTNEDMSINGWYEAVSSDSVLGLATALDAKGIEHGIMQNSDSGYKFTSASIAAWSVGGDKSDGNFYGPGYAVWKWNPTDKWTLCSTFGTDEDTVYIISHEKFIDVSGDGAAMKNAGIVRNGDALDFSKMKAGYEKTGDSPSYVQLAPRDKAGEYADLAFGPSITITWEDYDEKTVIATYENVIYGSMPAFEGTEPVRTANEETYYTFKGWSPEFGQIYADITYIAQYTETKTVCSATWTEGDEQKTAYYDSIDKATGDASGKVVHILKAIELGKKTTLQKDTVIEKGASIIIPSNAKCLMIDRGVTLTVGEGGVLRELVGGTIYNSGSIVNNGTVTVTRGNIGGSYSGTGDVNVQPYFSVGDKYYTQSSTGNVQHKDNGDSAKFWNGKATQMNFKVLTVPDGWNDWSKFGTVELNDVSFERTPGLIYVPSYVVGMVTVGSTPYYTYYKVTSISDSAIAQINGKSVSVVLPQALRDTAFGESVTKVTSNTYTDSAGNVYYYDINETSPVWYDGKSTYNAYGNADENADVRYTEQATMTKIVLKGEVSPTVSLIKWSKHPMISPPSWNIGHGRYNCSVIGTTLSNDPVTVTDSKIVFSKDVQVEVEGSATLVKNTEFNGALIKKDATLTVKSLADQSKGVNLTIAKESVMTIENGGTLAVLEKGSVTNDGSVVNNGTIKLQKIRPFSGVTGEGSTVAVPFFNVGDVTTFNSGSGVVNHTDGWDKASFNDKSATTMNFTVLKAAEGMDDWSVYGTAELTSLKFQDNSDIVYIPSYLVGKVDINGTTYYTYVKVTSISDAALEQINGKTISVVLPQALKGTHFGDSVTILTGSHYVDSLGNTYYYDVNETSPIWYNGYTTYTVYAYADNGDVRYCEQGEVTKIVFADGITATTAKLSTWGSSPLASSSEWIGAAGSWGDIIGLAVTNDFDLSDTDGYSFGCDVEVKGNSELGKPLTVSGKLSFENVITDGAVINAVGKDAEINCTIKTAAVYAVAKGVSPAGNGTFALSVSNKDVSTEGRYIGDLSLVSRVMSATVTGISPSDVVVDIRGYGEDSAIPAGKLVLTYSAYVEGSDGVKLCPTLTTVTDVEAKNGLVSVPTEKAAVTCAVSYGYEFMGTNYFTPITSAKAPSVAILDLESDYAVSFNGKAVADGDLVVFDTYTVTVDTEDAVTVNGQAWSEGATLPYYGQKIVIAKV